MIDAGITWADEFLPNARKEYEDLLSIELEEGFVANNRSKTVCYSVTALQLMAGCFYEWHVHKQSQHTWHELADWLREADFDVDSEECIFLKTGMLNPGDSALISQRQRVKVTISHIVTQTLIASSKG